MIKNVKIAIIFGTRPQIIKTVSIIRNCLERKIPFTIINTGQHYDFDMSRAFFQEFDLALPQYNLGVGSGTHGWQTGNIIIKTEKTLERISPTLCIVPGDTNSALASALAAVKIKIPVVHLEAGLRSYEEFMPEEINRRAIDHFSQLLLAPTAMAEKNLIKEGIRRTKVVKTGDTMYDLFTTEQERIRQAEMPYIISDDDNFVTLTIHREENLEMPTTLIEILKSIKESKLPTIFPVHPRTKKRLKDFGLLSKINSITNLFMIKPVGYHSMMKLIQNSLFVMTDSGGLQKEAFIARVPCITLRNNTEWVETVQIGANVLVRKLETKDICNAINYVTSKRESILRKIKRSKNPFGDGKASKRTIQEIMRRFS